MATRIEITCIVRSNYYRSHERIVSIGGITADGRPWKMSHEGAVRGVEDGKYEFHVSRAGRSHKVVVAFGLGGRRYLKTVTDDDQPDNLLSLPECPDRP